MELLLLFTDDDVCIQAKVGYTEAGQVQYVERMIANRLVNVPNTYNPIGKPWQVIKQELDLSLVVEHLGMWSNKAFNELEN